MGVQTRIQQAGLCFTSPLNAYLPHPPVAGQGTEGHRETAEKTRCRRAQPLNKTKGPKICAFFPRVIYLYVWLLLAEGMHKWMQVCRYMETGLSVSHDSVETVQTVTSHSDQLIILKNKSATVASVLSDSLSNPSVMDGGGCGFVWNCTVPEGFRSGGFCHNTSQ